MYEAEVLELTMDQHWNGFQAWHRKYDTHTSPCGFIGNWLDRLHGIQYSSDFR